MRYKLKILIVEDDPDLREIMSEQFLDKNWTVFEAANGREGLLALETEIVDLVLTDVIMPVFDGMSFLKEFKARYQNHPPIFIMSGGNQYRPEDFINAGATGYFTKPVSADEILSLTKNIPQKGRS